ncbi:MAG: nickel-responsive transcriptional regulator NikR [Bacillota bacterium]
MEQLARFGVSMAPELLEQFDELVAKKGYANRSEAIRDLIRGAVAESRWEDEGNEVAGAICIIYDHHGNAGRAVADTQHKAFRNIVSTTHVHLSHESCLEVLVVKGRAGELKTLADNVTKIKGVKYGRLVLGTTGENLP